ncbi:unnamed protein product [Timema podura]|uniref:Uncharacterized protein n=1 Tax=Timema podura TaxID=61482 RepID=A0ABN7PRU9_TIMPD|nr:unnamed protein product [Timema podura]
MNLIALVMAKSLSNLLHKQEMKEGRLYLAEKSLTTMICKASLKSAISPIQRMKKIFISTV